MGDIASKIRNIFQPAEFVKRNDDDTLQIQTAYNRTIDNVEPSYPYGFAAKATKGKITVLCAGGNLDAVRVLPVEDMEDAPELEDGDVALYSEGGSYVICRADGTIDIMNGEQSLNQLMLDLTDILKKFGVFGSSTAQKTDPSTVQGITQWENNWKKLFKEQSDA